MRSSNVTQELLFLVFFVGFFAVAYTVMRAVLLPLHYNKTVVLVLASILVAVATIGLRYWFFTRNRPDKSA